MAHQPHAPMPVRKPNRLAKQTSPYLIQHAHNPVEWWPWGPEAFADAKRRDVPIFLSIGYSTCYWCHVMERESFESEAIAAQMNDGFVCIKVDREERPDVDDIYMAAVQAFSGHGGWPMSVFLEPGSLKPFWAGTYFPAQAKFPNIPTFPSVLSGMSAAWRTKRAEVLAQADELADAVGERISAAGAPVALSDEHVTHAVAMLLRMLDRNHGGFDGGGGSGRGPKFPQPVFIELLLAARRASADEATTQAIDAAIRLSLEKMACGGIFDHVGGGFHRYSVDGTWTVPHFEKMLYDNAQLAAVYARAWSVYRDPFYRRTASRTLEYVLREMTDATTGAFFSAQDAEVNHREGQNYLWTRGQLVEVLGEDDGAWAARVYGVERGPNFRDPHHPDDLPSSVLRLADRPERVAAELGLEPAEFLVRLDRVNAVLLSARARRDQPLRDDKSLAGWNGLMIGAMSLGGALLNEPKYVEAARRAADFILSRMRDNAGGLLRSCRSGVAHTAAFLEDYGAVIAGLIELHRTGVDPSGRYLDAARTLSRQALEVFGGPGGEFYDTAADQADLFVRARSLHDGATPCGAGLMLLNLLDLAATTGDPSYRQHSVRALVAASGLIAGSSVSATNAVRALMVALATDRAGVSAAFAGIGLTPAPVPGQAEHAAPVEILAERDRVEIGRDKPASLRLRVKVAPGFHITAADPGTTEKTVGLVPFRVRVINGSGVNVFADYPTGKPYAGDAAMLVYQGEFDLQLAFERTGEWVGRPLLAVTFQPCTDSACLAAQSVELDVALDPR